MLQGSRQVCLRDTRCSVLPFSFFSLTTRLSIFNRSRYLYFTFLDISLTLIILFLIPFTSHNYYTSLLLLICLMEPVKLSNAILWLICLLFYCLLFRICDVKGTEFPLIPTVNTVCMGSLINYGSLASVRYTMIRPV